MRNDRIIFLNENLDQFDISTCEYIGIEKVSSIPKYNINNVIILKSIDDFDTVEVMFHFVGKTNGKNYYFLINDFGFMKYSVYFSEKYNLLPIIEEYNSVSLSLHAYNNAIKIDIDRDALHIQHKLGMSILSLVDFKDKLSKYYPEVYTSFIDELEDFSYKMIIKKEDLKDIDETMMIKLQKQFSTKTLENGFVEFYKLKFSYEK